MATYGNGNPMNVVITDPETGEKIGEKTFYDNKQVHTDVLIKDNKRNGTCRSFYKDGKPFSLHTYELGVKNGPYQLWYENGQIKIDGFYKDNKPSGVWKTYEQGGKLIKNENSVLYFWNPKYIDKNYLAKNYGNISISIKSMRKK